MESQILPLVSLSVDSNPPNHQQPYFLSDANASSSKLAINSAPPAATINSPSSALSQFQKFKVHRQQQQHHQQQQFSQPTSAYSSVEKKRRIMFNNSSQHQQHLLLEANLQQQQHDISTQKMCARCRTSNSPEWRRGPDGHKT